MFDVSCYILLQVILQMEKRNLLHGLPITMSVCFIRSTAKETLFTLKKRKLSDMYVVWFNNGINAMYSAEVWELQDDNFFIVKHH